MKKQIIFFGITVLTIFTGCFSANRCFAEETWFSESLADCMKSLEDDFVPPEDDTIFHLVVIGTWRRCHVS